MNIKLVEWDFDCPPIMVIEPENEEEVALLNAFYGGKTGHLYVVNAPAGLVLAWNEPERVSTCH